MRWGSAGTLPLLLLATVAHESSASASSDRPSIVFVLVDDVGWADFSYNHEDENILPGNQNKGDASFKTPFIDEISSKGIRFEQHYVQPMCTPTRASLLTGRFAANTGLTWAMLPGSPCGIPDDQITLPQFLKDEGGYKTYMSGKWHLGHAQKKQTPCGKGFQEHRGIYMWDVDSYTKQMFQLPWEAVSVDWVHASDDGNITHWADPRHATEAITAEAVGFMERHNAKHAKRKTSTSGLVELESPLFLYVAYTAAHAPLQPLPRHYDRCQHIAHLWRREYCGMVLGLDEGIQNVTEAALENLGDNTVLIVVSDNGGSTWFGGLNYPFRGSKTTPFEGGVRVPAFVYDLSQDKRYFGEGGRVFSGMMHVSDWFPTLGLPPPPFLLDY